MHEEWWLYTILPRLRTPFGRREVDLKSKISSRWSIRFMAILHLLFLLGLAVPGTNAQSQEATGRNTDHALPNDFAAKTTEYLQARARVTGFSGAVLVAFNGQPVFREAFGLANHELEIPNTPTTKFRTGSITKQFAAAAILLLEQRGQLKLTDPVSKYLSDWPPAWNEVTVHHLLSHTAGLPQITTQALLDVSALTRSSPKLFASVHELMRPGEELQPLLFRPGEEFAYSNVGYIILGMVIKKTTGKDFCDFVSEEIFELLKMSGTACEDPGTILRQRANGYVRGEGQLTNAGYVDVRFVGPAGSIYSTIDDLLTWEKMLGSDRLLSGPARTRLFTPVQSNYAYGWWIQERFSRRVQWHGGNVSGFVAHIARYPDDGLFVAVLSNIWSSADRGQVRAMANELSAIAFGEKYVLPYERKRAALEPADYDAYVGTYRGKDTFAIARESSRLVLQIPPGVTVFEIFPESPTKFFASRPEYFLEFKKNGAGQVISVVVRNEGEEAEWIKMP